MGYEPRDEGLQSESLQGIVIFRVVCYIGSFDTLSTTLIVSMCSQISRTVNTNSKSSSTSASWISSGIHSNDSCLVLPFDFGEVEDEKTRELSGACTKDVSAIKDESLWPKYSLVSAGAAILPSTRTFRVPLQVSRVYFLFIVPPWVSMPPYRRDCTCNLTFIHAVLV